MSEPISELVRAYTAEIASLRNDNERLQRAHQHDEKTIEMLQSEVYSLRASVGAGDTAIRYLEMQIDAYERALREIREFSAAHHRDEETCRWIHALTVDIPAMCDMVLPLPTMNETVEVSSDSTEIPF